MAIRGQKRFRIHAPFLAALGIARSNKFVGLCARLAQTFLFSSLTNINYLGGVELKTFCIFAAFFLILQCCLLIELIYALR